MNKNTLYKLIDSRFHHLEILDKEITYKHPKEFIDKNRIDLPIKIEYIKSIIEDSDTQYFRSIYQKTINYFSDGLFYEPGDSKKNTFQDFDDIFLKLYLNIKEAGFLLEKGVIPLSKDGVILDGAHRVAIAYLLNIKIPTIKLNVKSPDFGINFFKRKGATHREILDFIKINTMHNKKLRTAIIWPYNCSNIDNIQSLYSNIIYTGSMNLNLNGIRNLCLLCYSEESWVGNYLNNWSGIKNKADSCYNKDRNTIFFIYEKAPNQDDISLKEKVRNLTDGSKNNIHTTDNIEETKYLLNTLLRTESEFLLNNLNLKSLSKIYESISLAKVDTKKILVTGSSVLSLLNIRDNNDIDILHEKSIHIESSSILGSHNEYQHLYEKKINLLIQNPLFHYNFLGIKFIDIHNLSVFKSNRHEKKDILDIKLINRAIKKEDGNLLFLKAQENINRKSRILYFRYRQYLINCLKKLRIFNLIKKLIKNK